MKTSGIIGISVLMLVWLWLCWGLFSAGGFNLKNILVAAMTGIIIFVPLYKKYFKASGIERKKTDNGKDSRE